MVKFSAILAVDDYYGIGKNNRLPWNDTPIAIADKRWFLEKTAGSVVIMGRLTWESIGARPLIGRINVILSRNNGAIIIESMLTESPIVHASSLACALLWCDKNAPSRQIFVIGGAKLYDEAFAHIDCEEVILTHIRGDYECDVAIDSRTLYNNFSLLKWEPLSYGVYKFRYAVSICQRKNGCGFSLVNHNWDNNDSEIKYLQLLKELTLAPLRNNRTSVQTRGLFARSLRFPLSDGNGSILPLFTSKYISFKAIYHELIWFLRGSTNMKYLTDNDIHIWDGNSSREYLDSVGLNDYDVGEVGPIYGSQWRDWNNVGIDQLSNLIENIKSDPYSRRHLVIAWNPQKNSQMALPACHYSFQMYVEPDSDGAPKWLSCMVNMRSWDQLAFGFNIVSYSLLTHMIALICNLTAKEIVISACDVHMYETHFDAVIEQLKRKPNLFPQFEFSRRVYEQANISIDDFAWKFSFSDMQVINYHPYPTIKMGMVI